MRTLENPVLNEELVGPMVCWLEIELSLIESTYDVPALMLVFQPGRSSSLGPSVWHSPLANRSWAGTPPNRTLKWGYQWLVILYPPHRRPCCCRSSAKQSFPQQSRFDLTGRSTRPGTFFLLISLDSSLPQFYVLQTARCCWADSAAQSGTRVVAQARPKASPQRGHPSSPTLGSGLLTSAAIQPGPTTQLDPVAQGLRRGRG